MKIRRTISLLLLLTLLSVCIFGVKGGVDKTASAMEIAPRNISISQLSCTNPSFSGGNVSNFVSCIYFAASKVKVEIVIERSSNNVNFSEFAKWIEETTSKTYRQTKQAKAESGFYYRTTVTATTYDANNIVIESRSVCTEAVLC